MRPSLLAVFLLAPAAVRAAGTGADAALDALDARVSRLEAQAAGPAACAASATDASIRADLSGTALSASARGVLLTATRPALERLYNARAFQAGGPDACGELAPLNATVRREKIAGDLPFDLLCRTNYYEALMAKATMGGGGSMFELCLLRNRVGDRDFKLDSLDASCRIIADRKGSVDEVCARLTPYYDNASIARSCPRMLRYVSGDESVCREFTDELVRERCAGYAAYGKRAAGDAAPCARSAHCLMMTGRAAEAADAAAKEAAAAACGVYARREIRAESARAARDAAAALARDLAREADAAAGREEAASRDARLERAARLEERAARLAARK